MIPTLKSKTDKVFYAPLTLQFTGFFSFTLADTSCRYFVAALVCFRLLMITQPTFCQNITDKNARSQIKEITTEVDNQKIHYLKAGSGPITLLLIHGWPESSYMWRGIIPSLLNNNRFTIVAPDLRGIGGTSSPSEDYQKSTMAGDIHKLVKTLKLKNTIVIGHDIGGMVAYAYARRYPKEILGLGILDVPLPGIAPWSDVSSSDNAWHFKFHNQNPLAEKLVMGKQAIYFRYFINSTAAAPSAIRDVNVTIYAKAYGSVQSLHAGFEFYRAFKFDKKFNTSHSESLNVPVLLAGADHSMGSGELKLAQGLRLLGVKHITVETIQNSGHWITEENPQAVIAIINSFVENLNTDTLQ